MSARRVDGMVPTGLEELIIFENSHLKQINGEMKKNLDGLEQDVKEAQKLVHKTQSKVEELAISIGEIEKPK
jgi:hypothetical protein